MAAKNVGQGSVRRLRWRNNRNHKSEALRFQWGSAKAWLVVSVLHTSGPRGFRFAMATLVEESKMSKGQPAIGRLGLYCLNLHQLHGAVWTLGRLGCGRMQEPLSHLRVMASSGQSGWITTTKRHIYRGHIQECPSGHHWCLQMGNCDFHFIWKATLRLFIFPNDSHLSKVKILYSINLTWKQF